MTLQRDEAVTQVRDLPKRLERMGTEYRRAMQLANDATAERDEARKAWEKLRLEVAQIQAIAAAPAKPAEPKKIEPRPVEVAFMAQRAQLVDEQMRLQSEAKKLGKLHDGEVRAKLTTINAQLVAFAPKVKAFKAARHAQLMAALAQVLQEEAERIIGQS